MKKYYLFDLDGTVLDSKVGVLNSFRYCLKKLYEIHHNVSFLMDSDDELIQFVGPSLQSTFNDFFKLNEEDSVEAIRIFREYYLGFGQHEVKIFEGIEDVLSELKKMGKTLVICTSKNEKIAIDILKSLNLYDYFDLVVGSIDGSRETKDLVIKEAVRALNIDANMAIMIGDKIFDIEESRVNGIESVGCTYGYATSLDEFKNATYLVNSCSEILDLAKKL